MPLLAFWASNPDAVDQLTIEQIVSNAGDGVLRDNSECSSELRTYLAQISSDKIGRYIDHCLNNTFPKNGLVLQDLVNELGRRLDYEVEDGRYQGVTNAVGYDGIWQSPEHHFLVVEVKTTDAYRISLDVIAKYRSKLLETAKIGQASSVLIVVGRQETGELEAQIRGSRHAWDVRVISIEALLKLVALKENSEADVTGRKIRSLLTPVEYTRLDQMVDVMFTAAKDVEGAEEDDLGSAVTVKTDAEANNSGWQFTSPKEIQAKREKILAAFSARENVPLVRRTRALYWNAQHGIRLACSVSKRYEGKGQYAYWYAYHPSWDAFLADAQQAFFVLGCMDRHEAYAIPRSVLLPLLPHLNTTTPSSGGTYWHIHLTDKSGKIELLIPKQGKTLDLDPFRLKFDQSVGDGPTD